MTDAPPRSSEGAGVETPLETTSGTQHPRRSFLTTRAHPRLKRLLVLKSAVELILVTALASVFFFQDFGKDVRGEVETAEDGLVKGWVMADDVGDEVELQLFIDGHFTASTAAKASTTQSGVQQMDGVERRGFMIRFEPLTKGEHEARVYALSGGREDVRRSLKMIGKPFRFRVE